MRTTKRIVKTGEEQKLILPHGGYQNLRSFQTAQLVYDATVVFCNRFVDRRSRTRDQMVQAARSGVQNIAEGSMASAVSKRMELKLTGVARASLEELLLDYKDFIRQRGLHLWAKDSSEALAVRNRYRSFASDTSDRPGPSEVNTTPIPTASTRVPQNSLPTRSYASSIKLLARPPATQAGAGVRLQRSFHGAPL